MLQYLRTCINLCIDDILGYVWYDEWREWGIERVRMMKNINNGDDYGNYLYYLVGKMNS